MIGKRILIIEVNWLGDVLFSTPFIRAVRDADPNGYIACLVHPRCKEILEDNPAINEIISYDEGGLHRGVFGKLKLILSLRRKHFDTVYILHRSFTKAFIGLLTGARARIGYPTKGRERLLTIAVDEPDVGTHSVRYFLNLAGEPAAAAKEPAYEFFVNDADRRYIKDYLSVRGIASDDKFIALCPGGNWGPKRWPKESFAALADMLAQKYNAKVVITGGTREKELAESIGSMMKQSALVTCGDTNLKQLGAIFERSCLVVANDTGSMHIAVATGTKVIALFGPTSPEITGPYGTGNYRVVKSLIECDIPCYDVTCRDNRCMKAISVEEVFKEAVGILS
ncbi:MAG: lipopolysaccharide heptosyltransferase II [Candidatus Omnitrophica bacterium]|nr:lipopolysaccharide heptosyltransferase II [Candidatus Omnitrophota bacterium]